MKRIFLLGIVILTSVVLTGCSLIPSDIQDQLSEELCKEDPNNELCNIENIEDLEDEVVMNLVEEAFIRAKEKANKTKCSDVFSPTNPDLLESCRMEETDLIPTDITEFYPFFIEVEGNVFTVTGTTNLDTTELTIKVSVVEIEGVSYIDSFVATRTDITSGEVTESSAKDLLDKFFMEFDDKSIPTDVFCSNYYDGIDNDCNSLREDFFGDNEEIVTFEYKSHEGNIFVYHVTVLKLDGTTESVDVEVEVFRQEFGPVQVKQLTANGEDNDCDGVCLDEDKAKELFMEFANDYFNPDLTDEEVANKWLTTETLNILENRQNELEVGLVYFEVISAFNVDSFFDIEFKLELQNEEPYQGMLRVQFELRNDNYVITYFEGEDNDCDGVCVTADEAKDIFQMFADDYFDASISNDELDQRWLYGMSPFVLEERHNDLDKITSFTVTNAYIADSFFDIEFKIEYTDGTSETGNVPVVIYLLEDMNYMVMFLDDDDDGDSIPIDEAEGILREFFNDFLNPELTDDEFLQKYFDGDMNNEMYRKRKDKTYSDIVFINIYESDGDYFIIDIETTTNGVTEVETLEVRVNRWESKLYIQFGGGNDCDVEDCYYGYDPMEVKEILNVYFDSFFDVSISDDELYNMYLDQATPSDYLSFRQTYLQQYTMVEVVEIFGYGDEFTVVLDWSNNDGSMRKGEPVKVKVIKQVDKATPVLFITDPGDDFDHDGWPDVLLKDSFFDVFTSFVQDYFDQTVTDDVINSLYFDNMMDTEFFTERQELLLANGHVTILKAHAGDDFGWYFVELEVFDGIETMEQVIRVQITTTDTGYFINFDDDQCDDCHLYPYDSAMNIMNNFKASFNHQSIISETMCAMYTEYTYTCSNLHSTKISSGFMMVDFELFVEDYMYVVKFVFEDATGIKEEEIFHIYFYEFNDMVYFDLYDYTTTEERMFYDYLYEFESYINDLTIPLDEVCAMLTQESYDECFEIRTYLSNNPGVYASFGPIEVGDMIFVVEVGFISSDNNVNVVEYDVSLLDNVLHIDRGTRGTNPLYDGN